MPFENNINDHDDELSDDKLDVDDVASDVTPTTTPGSKPINIYFLPPNHPMEQEKENRMPPRTTALSWHGDEQGKNIEEPPTVPENRPSHQLDAKGDIIMT